MQSLVTALNTWKVSQKASRRVRMVARRRETLSEQTAVATLGRSTRHCGGEEEDEEEENGGDVSGIVLSISWKVTAGDTSEEDDDRLPLLPLSPH